NEDAEGETVMEKTLRKIAIENSDIIVDMWFEEIRSLKEENYMTSISDELFDLTNREFVNVILSSIKDQRSMNRLERYSEKIIKLVIPSIYVIDCLPFFRRVDFDFL